MGQRLPLRFWGFRGVNRRAGASENDAGQMTMVPTFELVNIDVSRLPEMLMARPTAKPLVEYAAADTTWPIGNT